MQPMLATRASKVPQGDDWSHEVKWDGIRVLAEGRPDRTRLYSRNGNDVSIAWPEVVEASPGRDLVLDGEVIGMNERGVPDFRVLQDRMHLRDRIRIARLSEAAPAIYMVFDLLRLDGCDLTGEPLEVRRGLLADLGLQGWQVPPSHEDGEMLWTATEQQGLEGVVSKRKRSRYSFGTRSRDWIKVPHRDRLSYVVGGWRPQEGTSDRLAALLVGELTPEGLLYRGRVGSGIGPKQGRVLAELVADLGRSASPFDDEVPAVDAKGTHWLEPVLVVDIDTHGRGYERLRQPSFQGVRTDLTPEDLRP